MTPCNNTLLNPDGTCLLWTLYSDAGPVLCVEKIEGCRECVRAGERAKQKPEKRRNDDVY